MSTQYSYSEALTPEFEYHAEEIKKRMLFQMANFAQVRFKRSMQFRMTLNEDK